MSGYLELAQLPDPISVTHTKDYEIALEAGALSAGAENSLAFRITLKGQDVEQLDPYLGTLGHLVALREDDFAFLHVHPTGGGVGAPDRPSSERTRSLELGQRWLPQSRNVRVLR